MEESNVHILDVELKLEEPKLYYVDTWFILKVLLFYPKTLAKTDILYAALKNSNVWIISSNSSGIYGIFWMYVKYKQKLIASKLYKMYFS